jgi:hydrogenase maturation protein HypF
VTLAALERVADATRERVRIDVRGVVQGVGFRPFVYRRATALGLRGWVANTPEGVTIEAEGTSGAIAALVADIRRAPPPGAIVAGIASAPMALVGDVAFAIRGSVLAGPRTAEVLPDVATCAECLAEMNDPGNRRHRYPFINCTHCGPRYSIIEALPYDRARTSMRRFAMCTACQAEYDDPSDRRFHAEPNACPACGPQLSMWGADGVTVADRDAALNAAADAIREGRVVAVKGVGGFHLIADARNREAVTRLRQRKGRPDKPFAVMFPSLDAVRREARVGEAEATLLAGRERPIVLLQRTGGGLADSNGPALLGAMLPYSPLHHLMLAELGFPVVATSGNRSEEPIATDEREAVTRLAGIADLFLVHDRPIVRAVDDSVVRTVGGRAMMIRRSRGYTPATVAAAPMEGILALGAHQKATVALGTRTGAAISQHIGDLETAEARDAFDETVADLVRLHGARPRIVAHDLHAGYHSTRAAARMGLPTVAVQHHVAHVAAVMAEHGLKAPVLGVAWDGTGAGGDGTIWGGEFILIEATGWRRVGHLRPFRLPGGEAAVREPRRSAAGLLHAVYGTGGLELDDLPPVASFTPGERATLAAMLERGINAPVTTSAGRLFDAVAAIAGLRQTATYEGQAAAELELAAGDAATIGRYEFAVRDGATTGDPLVVDWEPALAAIIADVRAGAPVGDIAAAFHAGLAAAVAAVAVRIGEPTVVLSGGCFQNARLTEAATAAIEAAGMRAIWPQQVPPNDGGIALGQAWWAMRTMGEA